VWWGEGQVISRFRGRTGKVEVDGLESCDGGGTGIEIFCDRIESKLLVGERTWRFE